MRSVDYSAIVEAVLRSSGLQKLTIYFAQGQLWNSASKTIATIIETHVQQTKISKQARLSAAVIFQRRKKIEILPS